MKSSNAVVKDDGKGVTTFAVVWIEIPPSALGARGLHVTTFAVVWIEIRGIAPSASSRVVTTFAVVWIEIVEIVRKTEVKRSPPSRWCGLK